jgi:hypothetical protein
MLLEFLRDAGFWGMKLFPSHHLIKHRPQASDTIP